MAKYVTRVHPTYSVSYYVGDNRNHRYNKPESNKHNGIMSKEAQKKIRNGVGWMMLLSEVKTVYSQKEKKRFRFKLNFITLTLSGKQNHTDQYITKHMLRPFLKWLERMHGAKMYIWKAETQSNGNIHYHITTHVFVHWKSIRSKWNRIQAKHGYCKVFQDGTNDKGNAATQIKAVKNSKHLGAYIAKYISKNDKDRRKVEGRLWGCTQNISNINCFIDNESSTYASYTRNEERLAGQSNKIITEKYYTVYCHGMIDAIKLPVAIQLKIEAIKFNMQLNEVTQHKVASLFQ